VYKKRGSLRGSFGRLSWKKNHLCHWTFDNAACRTNIDRKNGVYSSESPLIGGQIVILNDDHIADTQIFCGDLPLFALVEHHKVLILSSSALSASTGSEWTWIRRLLQIPLWIEEVHRQESAMVSTLRDQLDPRT